MSGPDDILTDAIALLDAAEAGWEVARAISSRSFLTRQLSRRFRYGRRSSAALGLADLLNRSGKGAVVSTLPTSEDIAALAPGIGIYGLFSAETGIGQSARRSALSLRAARVPVSVHNISMPESFASNVEFPVDERFVSPFDTVLIHLNPDSLLHHLRRCPIEAFVGRRRIGFWHWELPVFPAPWAKAFEKVHEVWAPSSFVAGGVAAATDLPVRVVPHAVPSDDVPQEVARRALGLPSGELLFLTIFDLNSFPERKNPAGAVRAFVDAFPCRGPSSPRLVLKCHGNPNRGVTFAALVREIAADNRFILIDEVFSSEEIGFLQAACDGYVSVHRSEGFGLNILESMVRGKPCIATGFSGNMDFMTTQNSLIVPFRMRRVEKGEYPHGEGQWWAEPNHDAAVDALRRVAAGGRQIEEIGRRAREDALRNYSFESVGRLGRATWGGVAIADAADRSVPS